MYNRSDYQKVKLEHHMIRYHGVVKYERELSPSSLGGTVLFYV